MSAIARKMTRRLIAAARAITRTTRYAALNGAIAGLVRTGNLVQASNYLTRLGLTDDEIRSYRSHFGKTTKRAYRTATGAAPLTCWIDVDGHYRQVCVYLPNDRAFAAGVLAYKRLNTLVSASYSEVA